MKNKLNTKILLDYLMLIIGSFIVAGAVNMLLAPNGVAPGGVTGLAVVIQTIFGFPIYLTNLIINIPLFIFGYKTLGKDSAIKTLFVTVVFTLALKVIPSGVTDDVLLASVFGGVTMGIGLGMIFYFGGTSGGSDLAGAILNNFFPGIKLSSFMMGIDIVVVALSGIVTKKLEIALYSIIALYLSVHAINAILEGPRYSKALYIITNKSQTVADMIMKDFDRGVTGLKGRGMYTGEDKEVLLVVVSRSQFTSLKDKVKELDPSAFIMIAEMSEVLGEGWS